MHEAWDDGDDPRLRVLVECDYADSPSLVASLIERHGFAVRTCEGPGAAPCDLHEHGACQLVDGADVVVNLLRDPEARQRVAHEVASVRRPPAVVAQGPPDPEVGGTVTWIAPPVTRNALISGITAALREHGAPTPTWGDGTP